MKTLTLTLAFALFLTIPNQAQDSVPASPTPAPMVPDVIDEPLPLAIGQLYAAGLPLGDVTVTVQGDGEANTVAAQSPQDVPVADVEAVDLILLTVPNITLFYDDDEFNILHGSLERNTAGDDNTIIGNLLFVSNDDDAVRLGSGMSAWEFTVKDLAPRFCLQIWAVPVDNFREPEECSSIREWFDTVNIADHFWIGNRTFVVYQDSLPIATCPQTRNGEQYTYCEIYAENAEFPHATRYGYFVYDETQFIIYNRTEDKIMPLSDFDLPEFEATSGDDIAFLPPQQCVRYYTGEATSSLLDCTEIGSLEITRNERFWADGFGEFPRTEDDPLRCPAPALDERMICVLPR